MTSICLTSVYMYTYIYMLEVASSSSRLRSRTQQGGVSAWAFGCPPQRLFRCAGWSPVGPSALQLLSLQPQLLLAFFHPNPPFPAKGRLSCGRRLSTYVRRYAWPLYRPPMFQHMAQLPRQQFVNHRHCFEQLVGSWPC